MERDKILEDILQYSGMDQASIDKCREVTKNSSIYNAKSDMLFRFGVMNGLMFETFEDYLDIFMVITDPNTGDTASLIYAAKAKGEEGTYEKSEDTIDFLIHDLTLASAGNRVNKDGQKVGSEVVTILMNAAAKMCASNKDMMDGFNECLRYWKDKYKDKIKEEPSDKID